MSRRSQASNRTWPPSAVSSAASALAARRIEIHERNVRSLSGERAHDLGADPGRAAGDDDGTVLEAGIRRERE